MERLRLYTRILNGHLQWPHYQAEVKWLRYQRPERLLTSIGIEEQLSIRSAKPGLPSNTQSSNNEKQGSY
ncbi:hypothetical protein L248_2807 [Schleiferilactobacillus shenzhenensis LY-73]|uniref:Uncharacterized protein n=1 Tax=Schleiferilactobacillus shenzhenensis LY-73 TaxID=1231336 RepID=U4TU63_9LACO|nr:hypothetical protein L248_2807 [Schleiferilactobacillus shenzhenensis LY-73]